jgi:hypothetical protein
MYNRNIVSLVTHLFIISLLIIGCGPKTPAPIIPEKGNWIGIEDPVLRVTVSNGTITGIYWSASKMVYIDSGYNMMVLSCGMDGPVTVQADGTFTFKTAGTDGYGKFDTPTSGHVVATFTSCKTHTPDSMFPVSVDLKEPLISNTSLEPAP